MVSVVASPGGCAVRRLWPAVLLTLLAGLALLLLPACGATQAAPVGGAEVADAERIATSATWSPGQLQSHFAKHGREGPYPTAEAYDSSARQTVRVGRAFVYIDRTTRVRRRGFFDPPTNRFTAVTEDGKRITTHFRPDSGEHYVKGLLESTYR